MNITAKCRCGAEFSIDYNSDTSVSSPAVYRLWHEVHADCKDKHFASHIPFKYLLRKMNDK